MNIVIAGGTGFIGKALSESLTNAGHTITLVSRTPKPGGVVWSDASALRAAVESADAVINLAGSSVVGQRWNAEFKQELWDSRIEPTKALAALKPRVLVQASAVGFYGDHGDDTITEQIPAAQDFFGELCTAWENAAMDGPERTCCLRIGQVFGHGGSTLEAMINPPQIPFSPWKLGLGGPLGSGRQWVPWVHLDDIVGLFTTATGDSHYTGSINAVSPNPVKARELATAIGRALKKPSFVAVPAFALKILVGEFTKYLLASQRVLPERALALGYDFRYSTIEAALSDLL
ncbi:MAG: TIGR01777 family oxidoreductase [Armatimonas sp.]